MHRETPRSWQTLGGLRPDDETTSYLWDNLAHRDQYGYGVWVFRGENGRLVGRAGLRNTRRVGGDGVELAYALAVESWNRRIATEVTKATLRLAFKRLGLTNIVCFTLATNRASQRVMEKAGFAYERDVVHAGLPSVLYRITAAG